MYYVFLEMALWIKIILKLGKLHHANPNLSTDKELGDLLASFLCGSLMDNDEAIAESILKHVWGYETTIASDGSGSQEESSPARSGEVPEQTISNHFEKLKHSKNQNQISGVQSLLYNIHEGFSTILCAPTMTGKSIMLQVTFYMGAY